MDKKPWQYFTLSICSLLLSKQYFFNTSLIKLGSDFSKSLGSITMRRLQNIKSGIIGGQLSG